MLIMMEGPERGLAYAIETLTTVGKTITKIDLGIRRCTFGFWDLPHKHQLFLPLRFLDILCQFANWVF